MTNHTPEPWLINEKCADEVGVLCHDNTQEYGSVVPILIAYDEKAKANASRIVACVNACAGISNDTLEGVATHGLANAAQQLADVTAQRDELLAALKKSDSALTKDLGDLEPLEVFNQAIAMIKNTKQIMRDAIAKCEVKP